MLLDDRAEVVLVRRVPVGDHLPSPCRPTAGRVRSGALVVHAANLDRLDHALEAEFLEARLVRLQVLEPQRTCSPVIGFLPNFFLRLRIASTPSMASIRPRL